jgi:hypothetical protein
MPPVDKKTALEIVEHFSKDAWSVECCGESIKASKICLPSLLDCCDGKKYHKHQQQLSFRRMFDVNGV